MLAILIQEETLSGEQLRACIHEQGAKSVS